MTFSGDTLCPGGHGLQILNAQEEDTGTYSCIVASEAGEAVKNYAVKVLGMETLCELLNSYGDPTTVTRPVPHPFPCLHPKSCPKKIYPGETMGSIWGVTSTPRCYLSLIRAEQGCQRLFSHPRCVFSLC